MPKHVGSKKPDVSSSKKPDTKGKRANNDPAPPVAKPVLTQKQLLFGSFTGKTPLTLLNEYCQKRGWQKPDIQSKQLSSNAFTGIVFLKKQNAKDASQTDTVVMKPPEDSEVAISRPSAAEARHFAALYALYRFANGQNLKNILPPLCRDYFALLEKHKAETNKTKAFLWAADPFTAAAPPPPPPAAPKKSAPIQPNSQELRLSQHALQEVEALLREHLHDLAPAEGQAMLAEPDQDELTRVKRYLESFKFARKDIDQAVTDVCRLRAAGNWSSPLLSFSPSQELKDAVLDYLLLLLPETALPPLFKNTSKSDMTARVHKAQDADSLSKLWLAERLHKDSGFPLQLVKESLGTAQGDEGLCVELLIRSSLSSDPASIQECIQSFRGQEPLPSDLRERREDEILTVKSIYPEAVQQAENQMTITVADKGSLKIFFHSHSAYPSPGSLPTLLCSIRDAPSYLNVFITLQAYKHMSEQMQASIEEGQGVLLELIDYLGGLIPATLASPPRLIDALPHSKPKREAAEGPASKAKAKSTRRGMGNPLSSRPMPSNQMLANLEALHNSKAYQNTMLAVRQHLPAWKRKDDIVQLIASNRITLIAGATGSGKTTQVPQYILDSEIQAGRGADCSIIVTQPRRLAATGVASRVAEERCSEVGRGDSLVGYQIRGEKRMANNCRLLFMTTGILLRTLSAGESDLKSISHVIVDEVHERSLESDILLLELKNLLRRNKKLKIILMSATMDESISAYFQNPPSFDIPGRTFPIQDFYLEDVIANTGYKAPSLKASRQYSDEERYELLQELQRSGISDPDTQATIGMLARSERIPPDLVARTVQHIVDTQKDQEGSILIFTSGVAEIDIIAKSVRQQPCAANLDIMTLHANQPSSSQKGIFASSRRQKVIVATNVAETSITIPDCRYVIDTGKVKEIRMVDGISRLLEVWTSKASAKQRRGRAGRTQNGICFKLYTRWTEDRLSNHTAPEIMRIPLENLVLSVKASHPEVSASDYLAQLITVPPISSINLAERTCKTLGVVTDEGVTSLGRFVVCAHLTVYFQFKRVNQSLLPLDLRLAKLLVLGSIFNCLQDAISLTALLSAKPLFLAPREDLQAAQTAKRRFLRSESDSLSDLSALQACKEKKGQELRAFAAESYISLSALEEIRLLEREYLTALDSAGLLDVLDLNSKIDDDALLKTILFASCMQAARVKMPEATFTATIGGAVQDEVEAREVKFFEQERVFLHPSSLLFGASSFRGRFITFSTKQITSKPFVRGCSTLSTIGLLLFSNAVHSEPNGLRVQVGDMEQRLRAAPKLAVLVRSMKQLFDNELARQFDAPNGFDAKILKTL